MRRLVLIITLILCSGACARNAMAEEVIIEHQGLDVVGNLELASGKSLRSDGLVILLHDSLSHHRAELMLAMQDILRGYGINSLAITLSLGLNERRGMFDCSIEQDHRHEDAVDELAAWVAWAKEKGAGGITLLGHGRGANQVALYAINKQEKLLRRVILLAPMMQAFEMAEADYQAQFGKPLRDDLARAEELVANEEGSTLLDGVGFLQCPSARVTATAFANYYNANPKFVTTNLLQSVSLPALVVIAADDPVAAETEAGLQALGERKSLSKVTIPGADRDFRDLAADEAGKKIRDFMAQRPQG